MKGKMGRKGRRGCGFVDGSARYVGDSWQRDGCIHCNCIGVSHVLLRTLSKDVFERRTLTGSEAFSLFICLDANKFVLLSFFSLITTIYLRVSTEPLPNDAITPLPVDVRCSKTLLLKLPIEYSCFTSFTHGIRSYTSQQEKKADEKTIYEHA